MRSAIQSSSSLLMILFFGFLLPAQEKTGKSKFYTQKVEVSESTPWGESAVPSKKKLSEDGVFQQGEKPSWIWGEKHSKNYFLFREFQFDGDRMVVKFTADNNVQLKLNKRTIGVTKEWQSHVEVELTNLVKGKNTFEAVVGNEGGVAGFVFKGIIFKNGKPTGEIISDGSWQAFEDHEKTKPSKIQVGGKLGVMPWGDVFSRESGLASGPSGFQVPKGFQVEKLFTVPKDELGSWVCIALDNKGRILASDQGGKGICRITPSPIGSQEPTKVELLDLKISSAQGMLYAFDSLYFSVNGGPGSGLYRARDTNNDDQFDEIVKLKDFKGGGEHGPHALRLSPDGKSIFVSCGNHTLPPEGFQSSRLPRNWSEDHILPRQWDANGHARGILAPGGYVVKTDPDGKTWEMFSVGYRNQYDFAFNRDGEMFVYDADMEWDMGMPWYRPTRVNHASSGSELGWRSGTGKWPAYYVDSLPAMVDVGPGSPVGVEFGYGTKFPAKYQKALYICDWTFGTMYAIHIEPDGSSYKATKEEFVAKTPLPLTDVVAGKDGALYFSVGGRGTQSELYRVVYRGEESTAPVQYENEQGKATREIRTRIERFHREGEISDSDLNFIIEQTGNSDRFIRYAARVALEFRKSDSYQAKILKSSNPDSCISGVVALARQADKGLKDSLLESLDKLDYSKLKLYQKLDLLRAYQLVFIRMGEPSESARARIAAKFDVYLPSENDSENRELVQLLVYLQSEKVASKVTKLLQAPSKPLTGKEMDALLTRNRGYGGNIATMLANAPDPQKISYLFAMRNLKKHWNMEDRKAYFVALDEARTKKGGASFQGFLNNMEKDALANATDQERLAVEALGLRKPYKARELPKASGPGKDWKLDALVDAAKDKLVGRNFKNGQKMYAAARCVVCHRFEGDGGATGPDLSQVAGRFSLKDLCESIVDPNKVISDQYKASVIETKSGKFVTGKVVSETNGILTVVTDPEDASKVLEIKKSDIEEIKVSNVSLMPADLLKPLNQNEVLDLLAYLLSRGDPTNPMFRK